MNVPGVAAFVLSICMETGAGDHWVIAQAETITTRMFAGIGVGVDWRHSANCKAVPGEPLIIEISTGAPEEQFPGALAYSRLAEGTRIEVLYDRVSRTVEPGAYRRCWPTFWRTRLRTNWRASAATPPKES
jgi:hypothetical protein